MRIFKTSHSVSRNLLSNGNEANKGVRLFFFVGYSVVEFITSKHRFSWHLNLPGPLKMVENFSLGFNSFLGLVWA